MTNRNAALRISFIWLLRSSLRRALSPTFPAGELVFFIPWRVVAENPARRISTCSGRLGGVAAAGRTMVMSPAAPDSFSVILRFGADDGARAIGATDDAAAVELRGGELVVGRMAKSLRATSRCAVLVWR